MAINAKKIAELIALLWALEDAKNQGLIDNPQSENLEVAIKSDIDAEIAG